MSAALTLAKPEHLERLTALCAAYHDEAGINLPEADRVAALAPLLDGMPYGAVYLIGPPRAPIGYIVICFSWSVTVGGLDAMIDELYIRPRIRGRGLATEALIALPKALSGAGLRAIHLEVDPANEKALNLYRRAGFAPRDNTLYMSKRLG